MNGATDRNEPELIRLLKGRIVLVQDEDEYRLDMSCELPETDYAEVIRRKSTMRNFCIRVNASVPLPRRSIQLGKGILAEEFFTSLMLVDSV